MPIRCTVSDQINAPPEAVFAVASDFANAPRRISGIRKLEMLTEGPVGVGTRFRETRVMFGKEASETMEVVEFQPGRSYTLRAHSAGCEYRTTVSVRPAPSGGGRSEITFDFTGTPRSLGAKVMGALMGPLIRGACVKAVKKDLADLKSAVESGKA